MRQGIRIIIRVYSTFHTCLHRRHGISLKTFIPPFTHSLAYQTTAEHLREARKLQMLGQT